jgi:hypothetical protein
VVSRTLNDPRPLACHRPAGPDDSPVLRAILGVPDGITDPVLTRRSCGGKSTPAATRCWSRWSWPASWGDPRGAVARLVDAKGQGAGDGRPLAR